MAAAAKLDAIVEALEMANDSTSSYFDLETGEVHSITEEEFRLAEGQPTAQKSLPDWQRPLVDLACRIQDEEGKRYLCLPSKFDIDEWEIMDDFSESQADARMRDDFRAGIHGHGAFRKFKNLLTEYNLWDSWNQFKQSELRQIAAEWCEERGIHFR